MSEIDQLYRVQRHHYPRWIKLFALGATILWAYLLFHFFWFELAYHKQLSKQIYAAENAFALYDYENSINLWKDIVQAYPDFKTGKTRLAASYFALCFYNEDFYFMGLTQLADCTFDNKELKKIASFLPEEYKNHFNSLWVKEKKS